MNPRVLIIISGDPRQSARPAEAVRIAAGVGTWKKAEITLYLRDASILALGEFADELVDGDNFPRYLPIVREFGRPVYVQQAAPALTEIEPTLPVKEISDSELAALAAQQSYVLRF